VLDETLRHCARSYPVEIGGILVGQYSADLRVAHVSDLIPAPSDSIGCRFSFKRGVRGLQQLLNRRWPQSRYYLGEWHFHPDGSPSPSGTDCDQMRNIASAISYQCPEPVMVIIGGKPPERVMLQSYVFTRGAKDAIPMDFDAESLDFTATAQ
jgi:integrative and conjugative element protein (TIGR02256 family)